MSTTDHAAPAGAPSTTAYDVVIVGGGAAGLTAAIALGRSLRSVLVVDGGEPRNAPALGVHNLVGREGVAPAELVAAGRREAEAYGVRVVDDRTVGARRGSGGFVVELAAGGPVTARRLLLATGSVDELPDVPGLRGLWGRDVIHCPYCHGYEARGGRIGVLGTGPMAVHQALMFRQLSERVTLFMQGMPEPEEQDRDRLAALGVEVVDGPVRELRTEDASLRAAVLDGGREIGLDTLVVAPRVRARADLFVALGGELAENVMGTFVEVDPMTGRTALAGVWAAGNVTNPAATVPVSAAAGLAAGAAINMDLITEEAAAAVRAREALTA